MTFDQLIAGLLLLAAGYLFGTARWKFAVREIARHRDKLDRDLYALLRRRLHERSRSLYWLTRERATRRYVQDMLRGENETWKVQQEQIERTRWN